MEKLVQFLGKQNLDGSWSISVKARELVDAAWVDFYDDKTGAGYQRRETMRERRGKEIEDYFQRCEASEVKPRLFEMTASARCQDKGNRVDVRFEALDDDEQLGFVQVATDSQPWMSMIDGGTRLLGIQRAVASRVISPEKSFDVRLFGNLSVVEEIALFLLINENQKRVRTDLSLRVVQRQLDEGKLTDSQIRHLQTVVPDTEQWRYEASRIAARLNADPDSEFQDLVQMPGDSPTGKSVKMQALWTSLKHVLADEDLNDRLRTIELPVETTTEFWVQVLKNYWKAVADANPDARAEPKTNVLWGSIGVSASHRALAEVARSVLSDEHPDFSPDRFKQMAEGSYVADYSYWYARKGRRDADAYPGEKGEATQMTGNSGYIRLAKILENQWRSTLHAAGSRTTVTL